jgi:hypothetical protein
MQGLQPLAQRVISRALHDHDLLPRDVLPLDPWEH